MEKIKRHFGDKKDGRLIRGKELDTNHYIMPLIWPRRTDNEAFISEQIDLTAIDEYLKLKNEKAGEKRFSLFTVIVAAMGKTFLNRPRMNRFYRNGRLYERYRVSIGFVVKKAMTDDAEEALARIYVEKDDTIDTIAEKLRVEIENCRKPALDKTSKDIAILMKLPHFFTKFFVNIVRLIDKKTSVPEVFSASDLFFNSIVLSHLGSIKLHAGYHHLSNWGTNSYFTIIGEKKVRPFYDREGNATLHDSVDLGMTIDERIADGFYFSKTIRLLKSYFANPEILEKPFYDGNEDKE